MTTRRIRDAADWCDNLGWAGRTGGRAGAAGAGASGGHRLRLLLQPAGSHRRHGVPAALRLLQPPACCLLRGGGRAEWLPVAGGRPAGRPAGARARELGRCETEDDSLLCGFRQ